MADIELVIKIPDEEYKKICLMSKDGIGMALYDWIANGTPLPKGHGDLIDIQPLMRGLYEEMSVGELTYTTSEVYKMLEEECPVIIEADKENEK